MKATGEEVCTTAPLHPFGWMEKLKLRKGEELVQCYPANLRQSQERRSDYPTPCAHFSTLGGLVQT